MLPFSAILFLPRYVVCQRHLEICCVVWDLGASHPWLPWSNLSESLSVSRQSQTSHAGPARPVTIRFAHTLTPPSIQNPSLASAHRELAAARRVSSRGRLHQGLRLLHVDDSMRRGGSVMSGVSPPAPQPAANARRSRRLAQPRTRPRWPLRRFAANRIFEPITNWPPRFVSVLFPNSPPKTKALLPAQSRSAFPPATDPSFASAHQRKKRAGTHHLQSRQPKSAAT